jgi:hypothetical protein
VSVQAVSEAGQARQRVASGWKEEEEKRGRGCTSFGEGSLGRRLQRFETSLRSSHKANSLNEPGWLNVSSGPSFECPLHSPLASCAELQSACDFWSRVGQDHSCRLLPARASTDLVFVCSCRLAVARLRSLRLLACCLAVFAVDRLRFGHATPARPRPGSNEARTALVSEAPRPLRCCLADSCLLRSRVQRPSIRLFS